MVEPAFFALTSTPSIAPSSLDVTFPTSCAPATGLNSTSSSNEKSRMEASLVLDQRSGWSAGFFHHEDERLYRNAVARIARHDVDVVRRFVVGVAGIQRHRLATLQLHDELAFENMQEHVSIVAVRRIRGARRIDIRAHQRFPVRQVRQLLDHQILADRAGRLRKRESACRDEHQKSEEPHGHLLSWMEQQLLHAPVQELGDIEQVLRWAGNLVDPAELLQLLA